ncbi:MAG: hypothetical protein ACE5JZ_01785 [Kiloniellales bacterium]
MAVADSPRRSFVYRKLEAAGASFAELDDGAVAADFGDPAGEAEAARRLGLTDLSPLPRAGFKGAGTAEWLAGQGVSVPEESNQARRQADGSLIARLAPSEVLLLGDLEGSGALLRDLARSHDAAETPGPPRGYLVPRQDSHAWFLITGDQAAAMFAKLCAVDLRPDAFAPGRIAQTTVAELSAIVVRDDRGGVLAYHLLANSAAAEYLWDCVIDAMSEFDGRPVGWAALSDLASNR